jgi:hypothetical protein
VVDRYLSARPRPAAPAAPAPAIESRCACTLPKPATPAAAPAPPPAPKPEPPPPITDFVCESDVRDAMKLSKKIFIGPKTIVTPAARELANQYDILVIAKR